MAELFAKYSCTNCQEDIPGIRVHCCECVEFDLCIQCFASGAEIGPHKNNHKYQLTDSAGTVQLSRAKNSWSAREELHLLDAIEQYGFGNWEDISLHIETRSPEDAKEEYISKYLNGCIGRNTWANEQLPKLVDHTVADRGPLSQLVTQRLAPIDVTPEEAMQLHYLPHRNDFEREYDPTAETLVSSLFLSPDDEECDIVLKLAQIDIYTRKLRERTRRKRLVRDYQLIANFFRGNQRNRRQSKDQREFRDRYRVFAQFYTAYEFNRRLAAFEREKALRVRLSELYRYRWNGLTRIDECTHFEQHAAVIQNKNTGPYGQQGKTDRASGERQPSSSHCPPPRKPPASESEKTASSSSTDPRSTHHTGDPASSDASSHSRNSSDSTTPRPDHPLTTTPTTLSGNPAQQPGGQLLTTSELKLCSNLKIPATRYVTLKTVLMGGFKAATAAAGGTSAGSATAAGGSSAANPIEAATRNFLTKAGWLQHLGTI